MILSIHAIPIRYTLDNEPIRETGDSNAATTNGLIRRMPLLNDITSYEATESCSKAFRVAIYEIASDDAIVSDSLPEAKPANLSLDATVSNIAATI